MSTMLNGASLHDKLYTMQAIFRRADKCTNFNDLHNCVRSLRAYFETINQQISMTSDKLDKTIDRLSTTDQISECVR